MFALTYFPRLRDAAGKRVHTTWPKLVSRLTTARELADKHAAPGLSLATFKDDRRSLANVDQVFAVGIDLDHLDALSVNTKRAAWPRGIVDAIEWDGLTGRFDSFDSFVHTTWSSTETNPRARLFLRLSRPITTNKYRRVYEAVARAAEYGGLIVDRAASDPSGRYRFSIGRGRAIDVEGALASVPPSTPPSAPAPHRRARVLMSRRELARICRQCRARFRAATDLVPR